MKRRAAYRVPTMREVAEARGTSGYRVVSTFSGSGASCLGYELAGFQVVWASEFVAAARETYAANHPDVPLDARDIRDVSAEDVLRQTGLARGELDVLEGSPPCASFSTAGALDRHWGQVKTYSDRKQRTDDLFWEFARLLDGLQPRTFQAENVAGLVRGKALGYFKAILREFDGIGYSVGARVLDASWLGVPTSRRRLIFIGVRKDLVVRHGVGPEFPTPRGPRLAIRDVLDLAAPPIEEDPETGYRLMLDDHSVAPEWDKLAPGVPSARYFNLVRPDLRRPVPTLTAANNRRGVAGVTHPTQRRKLTLEEARVLSSFPPDFTLTGSYSQRWERIGRAVPPLMAQAIAETLRDGILRKIDDA